MMQAGLFQKPVPDTLQGVQLRPYQREALQAIRHAVDGGCRRMLVSLPTGAGKTVVFARLPQVLDCTRMLVLAHREELLDQAAAKLRQANPHLTVQVEQADRSADRDCDIVVASVATVGKSGSWRLEKWPPRYFDAVVVDEAHHASADSYVRVLRHTAAGEPDGPVLLGVTATPYRGDGTPLADVFDRVVYERTLPELIEQEYLCRVRGLRVRTDVNVSEVGTRLGDFQENQLARAVNTDYRNSFVCSAIENHAADRSCILVFAVNVAHVETLGQQLGERGHDVAAITGHTHSQERFQAVQAAREGRVRILVNCGVFTEGFDLPAIDCIVMARPTKSPLLYAQMLGRGTRPSPGKPDLLVIDVVDVCGRHKIQTAAVAFGLRDIDLLGGDVLKAKEACDRAAAAGIGVEDGESIEDVERKSSVTERVVRRTLRVSTVAQAIDVFDATTTLDGAVARDSIFPWLRLGPERYVLPMRDKRRAVLVRDALGIWKCDVTGIGGLNCGSGAEPPFRDADATVKRFAGTFRTKEGAEVAAWKPLALDARWRQTAPSDKQLALLDKLGVGVPPPQLTRGSATMMIDYLLSRRRGA